MSTSLCLQAVDPEGSTVFDTDPFSYTIHLIAIHNVQQRLTSVHFDSVERNSQPWLGPVSPAVPHSRRH